MSGPAEVANLDVVVAVLTYRRPRYLAELLPALEAEIALLDRGGLGLGSVGILVVDNDPEITARSVVAGRVGRSVCYLSEPRPGIAVARNAALDHSTDIDVLVFIDDDERPVQGWLGLLVSTFRNHDCAAVAGAVRSEFEVEPDEWVSAGQFFRRRRMPTGSRILVAATNNLLVDLRVVRSMGLRFDERQGLTGGEDTLFTKRLASSGRSMIWCNEAMVIDRVPAARVTRRWVLSRALSSGNSWTATALVMADTRSGRLKARARGIGEGAIRFVGGSVRALLGFVVRSKAHQARGLRTMMRGAGMVSGAVGFGYQEYSRTRPATSAPAEPSRSASMPS